MRVYLSGSITDDPSFMDKFDFAAKEAEIDIQQAHKGEKIVVVNPAKLKFVLPDGTHEEYMKLCFDLLARCDSIWMIEGWEASMGACMEYGYAKAKGMEIYT